ncbi:transcriptional regulator, TetR family [Sphingomonas laterariae]|uniref:Transcriptional regulator, TetR family n=1 Tax=Edaphosphingomonas laterariae TaxID=861865 RepID=A0A239G988_9SPHN|nr:TetR/AcrR family transcriptional regulator [Sphingomonas laterariae]SNS65670.1 transcriptional regulator, TetR family [Sphingomonas laterariae]
MKHAQMRPEDERRQRIIAEAAGHFLRNGFERTSMDRIAASAHVSKQAIYEYFRSKDDLFEQVVRSELREVLSDGLEPQQDVRSALETFADSVIHGFGSPRNYGLFRANIIATRQFPGLATALHEYRRGSSRALADYLEQLATAGRIGAFEGNALDLATRLGGMAVEGVRHFLGHDLPDPAERRDQARLAAGIFLHGYRKADTAAADGAAIDALELPEATTSGAQLRLKPERFALLCDAAISEFMAHGFDRASIDKVIAASGVGRSTIYRQFGNKQGLFRYVIGREIERIAGDAIAIPPGDDMETRLAQLARIVLDRHIDGRSIPLFHLLIEEAQAFPDLARAFYAAHVARAARPFAALLAEYGAPPPSGAMTRIFHTLATFGARYIATLRPVDEDERALVSRQAAKIICRGVTA